jgi:hypothetical protein
MDGSRVVRASVIFGDWSGAAMYSASRLRSCPRALMNVRMRPGSLSLARARGAPVRTGCPGLCSVSLPSSHLALVLAVSPLPARISTDHAARQASPVRSMAQTCRAMRLARAMATSFSGFALIMPPSQSSPGSDFLRLAITPMAPR